jgi:hypothetical protein
LKLVDERFGERVVVGVADRADGREHAVAVERLRVVDAGVLGGFSGASAFSAAGWRRCRRRKRPRGQPYRGLDKSLSLGEDPVGRKL